MTNQYGFTWNAQEHVLEDHNAASPAWVDGSPRERVALTGIADCREPLPRVLPLQERADQRLLALARIRVARGLDAIPSRFVQVAEVAEVRPGGLHARAFALRALFALLRAGAFAGSRDAHDAQRAVANLARSRVPTEHGRDARADEDAPLADHKRRRARSGLRRHLVVASPARARHSARHLAAAEPAPASRLGAIRHHGGAMDRMHDLTRASHRVLGFDPPTLRVRCQPEQCLQL